jgi:glutamine amidotransferase-like uncharacterized protein
MSSNIKPSIAIFYHHPECSEDCIDGMKESLSSKYEITTFSEDECNIETLSKFDVIAFPGGIGDASSYDKFFRRKAQNAVADYVTNGGRYLGICMGAYWAGSYYFDILDDVDAVQYIKRPTATIKRSYGTVTEVMWNDKSTNMYFYDGCALVGDTTKFKTIARYGNGDAMAIIQRNIGIIGCHPESLQYWYEKPWQYINEHWHKGEHHKLLLEFVDELMMSQ